MADVSEIAKLTPEQLDKVQSVISLFHILGLTDEDISLLPQVLKLWPKVVDTVNAHSIDLSNLKRSMASDKSQNLNTNLDTPENIRSAIGFGSNVERVVFKEAGDK